MVVTSAGIGGTKGGVTGSGGASTVPTGGDGGRSRQERRGRLVIAGAGERIGIVIAAAGTDATDESSAVEALGRGVPLLVEGDAANLKVTWPSDFTLAERVLARTGSTAALAALEARIEPVW